MNIEAIAAEFEAHRGHLEKVAVRMLGSKSDAQDAVQEAWLRLARSDPDGIQNLGGWLTTVVARVCLDALRTRRSRREDQAEMAILEPIVDTRDGVDPEIGVALADSVGLALLIILETLSPPERVAFVLHDLFGLPFDQIGEIVDKSPMAARQLASRARRRFQGSPSAPEADRERRRRVVEAYLAAARHGDFAGLLAVLDPHVRLRADAPVPGFELRGAELVAKRALAGKVDHAEPMLVDGLPGIVVAPHGKLLLVLKLRIVEDKVSEIEVITNPSKLGRLDLAVL